MVEKEMDAGLALAIKAAGGVSQLAKLLGVKHQAVCQWARVPAERIIDVEEKTGVSRKKLRPELYAPRKRSSV